MAAADVDLGGIVDGAVFAARTRHPGWAIRTTAGYGAGGGLRRRRSVAGRRERAREAARHGAPADTYGCGSAPTGPGAEIIVEDDGPGKPLAEGEQDVRLLPVVRTKGGRQRPGTRERPGRARRHGGIPRVVLVRARTAVRRRPRSAVRFPNPLYEAHVGRSTHRSLSSPMRRFAVGFSERPPSCRAC